MTYATAEQVIERYGAGTVQLLTDRAGAGVLDPVVLERALADAAAEIALGWLEIRSAAFFSARLAAEVLTRLAVDIAVYRLAAGADLATDERRRRYEDAVKLLERLARGEASLGLADPPASAVGGVKVSRRPRRFSREMFLSAAGS